MGAWQVFHLRKNRSWTSWAIVEQKWCTPRNQEHEMLQHFFFSRFEGAWFFFQLTSIYLKLSWLIQDWSAYMIRYLTFRGRDSVWLQCPQRHQCIFVSVIAATLVWYFSFAINLFKLLPLPWFLDWGFCSAVTSLCFLEYSPDFLAWSFGNLDILLVCLNDIGLGGSARIMIFLVTRLKIVSIMAPIKIISKCLFEFHEAVAETDNRWNRCKDISKRANRSQFMCLPGILFVK